jgi:hypothetical protein
MIAQSSCKTIRYNGWFAADDLISCCCGLVDIVWYVCNFLGSPDAIKGV